jgi:hypothetical protein
MACVSRCRNRILSDTYNINIANSCVSRNPIDYLFLPVSIFSGGDFG